MPDGYVQSMLGDKEKIVLITRQHWFTLVQAIITEIIVSLVIIGIVTAVFVFFPLVGTLSLFGLLLLVIPIVSLTHDALVWTNREYIVTNRRVIQISGVINKKVTDSSLEKVNDVKMAQSFWGRLFDFGDVEILTASELGINKFQRIGDPIRFKTAMLNAKEEVERQTRYTPNEDRPGDIPTIIGQLDKLRQQGILSETEFQAKKADLLKKL